MANNPLIILYDGWPLVRAPDSPAALHLLAILAHLPAEVQPVVALPGPAPDWLPDYTTVVEPTTDTAQGRLGWEQRRLPRISREQNASLIHYQTLTSPLFGRRVAVVSPSGLENSGLRGERSFAGRLLASIRQGGLTRARAVFWPEVLPVPELVEKGRAEQLLHLPQVVHPAFTAASVPVMSGANGSKEKEQSLPALDLPETFVLYHGPGEAALLDRLLKAWSWAAGAIGEYYPLLVLGLDEMEKRLLASLAAEYGVEDNLRLLPEVTPHLIPTIYRSCSAVFHPAPVPAWGGAVQHALACGKPVVGSEGKIMNAIVGQAAFLAPAGDARALGAALLTVIVEEQVAEQLSTAAWERVSHWGSERFGDRLLEAYRGLLEEG